jgi:hypothetical protein
LLFRIAQRDESWAISLARELWPVEDDEALEIIDVAYDLAISDQVLALTSETVRKVGFARLKPIARWRPVVARVFNEPSIDDRSELVWSLLTLHLHGEDREFRFVSIKTKNNFAGFLRPGIDEAKWGLFIAIGKFLACPSKSLLAEVLRAWAKELPIRWYALEQLPWPIISLTMSATSASELSELATQVDKGQFGDMEDWIRAEERWSDKGLTESDLELATRTGRFFEANVRTVGAPCLNQMHYSAEYRRSRLSRLFDFFVEQFRVASAKAIKTLFAELALMEFMFALGYGSPFSSDAHEVLSWLIEEDRFFYSTLIVRHLALGRVHEQLLSVADLIGRRISLGMLEPAARNPPSVVKSMVAIYRANPTKRGMLPFLLEYFIDALIKPTDLTLLKSDEFSRVFSRPWRGAYGQRSIAQ